MLKRHLLHALEERDVFRVRCRKPALDEIDAERVQALDNAQLVLKRQRDALALLSVSQRAVIREDSIHRGAPSLKKRSPPAGRKQRTVGASRHTQL